MDKLTSNYAGWVSVKDTKSLLKRVRGTEIEPKLQRLEAILGDLGSVVVGLSGGVDSTLLAFVARLCLGYDRVVAVTAVSESLPREELDLCEEFCSDHDIEFKAVRTRELENERYVENSPLRCYFCKTELFSELTPIAIDRGAVVVLGVNASDDPDMRPGQRAAVERGGRFPLREADLTKTEIRELARVSGLSTWDKPQAACLASRVPFGTPVTIGTLSSIDRVERGVRGLGFRQIRARHHGDLVRLEFLLEDLEMALKVSDELVSICKAAGYRFVTLDLEGFTSASFQVRSAVPSQDL